MNLCDAAEAPSITSGPYREISVAVGQSTTLHCDAAGSPPPKLAWYRGLLLPNSTDTLVVSGFKMDLKVSLTAVLLYWVYKCHRPHSLSGTNTRVCEIVFALSAPYK